MVLEATAICLDNSEWTRNGDYSPTRLEAQLDAANLICGAKTQSNPENTLGIVTMGGRSPVVQVALTQDLGKLLAAIASVKIEGQSHFLSALQIAELALKHRQNKNQRQRIVVFVASPLQPEIDTATLIKLGKRLKKNNIAVDIINFGEVAENTERLEAFVNAVRGGAEKSTLLTVPPGPHILSDVLLQSPIISDESGASGVASASRIHEFGVDPNLDPELAMVLRMSLEEENARQARLRQEEEERSRQAAAGEGAASGSASVPAPTSVSSAMLDNDESEEAQLARAIALSLQEMQQPQQQQSQQQQQQTATPEPQTPSTPALISSILQPPAAPAAHNLAPSPIAEDAEMSEEEQMARALSMSMDESAAPTHGQEGGASESLDAIMSDADFLSQVVKGLPGVRNADAVVKPDEKKEDKDKDNKGGNSE